MYETLEQKRLACERFLTWLKKNYPAREADIKILLKNSKYARAGNTAVMYRYGCIFKFEVAAAREMFKVLTSVAHEYQHVRQIVNEGIPISKIGRNQELAAWGFAMSAIATYRKEVNDRW